VQVAALSGGERGRLMLARLLLEPANVLVLDEPTNDLDIGTLTVLEQALARYEGTVILVSHDRAFMDRVASRVLAFEGHGEIVPVEGGYSDYLAWKTRRLAEQQAQDVVVQQQAPVSAAAPKPVRKQTKLAYKDQRELDALPAAIEAMETEQAELEERFCDPDYFIRDAEAFQRDQQRLSELGEELTRAYARWEELEALQESLAG